VVGVVDDFVYGDMFSASPMPMIFICNTVTFHQMTLRIHDNADIPAMLTAVERIVKAHNPEYPFEYRFVNDEFDKLFKNEALVEKLAGVFALLAIFISCLGLYGLAAYTASRRTREISIRKVLGASVHGIMGLLSKDFLKLVAIACLISFPAAWYIMREWLNSYEYKTPMLWWVFVSTGVVAMGIALGTVSFQTLNAAWVNPADKLKE
jgi:ABC-type antimicrobial peptide transport system permease subunit